MAAENAEPTKKSSPREVTADEVQDWIVEYLARELDISSTKIDPRNTFDSLALDSATAIGMTGDLESWLGRRIDPTVVYDYPTIEEFSEYLANRS